PSCHPLCPPGSSTPSVPTAELGTGARGRLAASTGLPAALAVKARLTAAIYDVPEGRPVWKTLPIRIAVTVIVMVLLAASAVAVVATGGLADRICRLLGL